MNKLSGEIMIIEEQDKKILRALQQNARMSNQELADAVNMSSSSCWRRVKALEENGVIDGYTASVNANNCGLNFQAIVMVQLTRHNPDSVEEFIKAVSGREEVLDCFATTGDADYLLRVMCKDVNAYNLFQENFLFRLPGVAHARTNLVLKEIKTKKTLPL